MANYVNNSGQTRLGWRVTTQPVVTPYLTTLLDLYSGAAAAYSLRKLKSSYTGSAIRVRRSSDNTELNIGFDSNGNLDTYALSLFVGNGNGFVTTWYDQSGNSRDVTQTTADNQPRIANGGIIDVLSNKPSIYFDGSNDCLDRTDTGMPTLGTTVLHISKYNSSSVGQAFVVNWGQGSSAKAFYNMYFNTGLGLSNYGESFFVGGRLNTNNLTIITKPNAAGYQTWRMYINSTNTSSGSMNSQTALLNSSGGFRIGRVNPSQANTYAMLGYISELVIWPSDLNTQRTSLEENANAYYSIYPNPTSVWNLLNAVYSADTIASSSLKTSLVASYNGESNTNDSFGTNNGTAVGGLTYSTGKIGNAFNFNGSNAYVSLPNNSFNPTGDFTISAWVNFATNTGYNIIYSSYSSGGTWGNGVLFYREGVTNNWGFEMRNGSGILLFRTPGIGGPANTWVHIVVVRVVGQDPKFYMNGSLVTGTFYTFGNSSINPSYGANQICNLGGYNNGSLLGNFKQDGTSLWNKALSASEITELYNSGNGAQYIGNDFYKPTTNDALGTNNGTAVGGLTYGLGKVGTAFVGNGTNGYVSLPNNSWNLQTFSINMWVYLSSPTTNSTFISNYYWLSGSREYGWILEHYNGSLSFYMVTPSDSNVTVSTSYSGKYNSWKMITLTKLQNGTVKIYIDGILLNTNYNTPTIGYNSLNYSSIGVLRWNGGISRYLESNGKIDAVGIWNKELTQTEITELYNSGNGKQYPN